MMEAKHNFGIKEVEDLLLETVDLNGPLIYAKEKEMWAYLLTNLSA